MRQWLIENRCFLGFALGIFLGEWIGMGITALLGANKERRHIE